jgi:hypothetical protein
MDDVTPLRVLSAAARERADEAAREADDVHRRVQQHLIDCEMTLSRIRLRLLEHRDTGS